MFSLARIGTASMTPLLYSYLSKYLPKESAAVGFALIPSLAGIAPILTPSISGWILSTTGSNSYNLYFVAALYAAAGVIMAFAARQPKPVATAISQPA